MQIVDHINGYAIEDRDGLNELITLSCLSSGLATIAQQVAMRELPIQQDEKNRRKNISFSGFGFFSESDEQLLPCFFHWYGSSVCNYARLAGFLSGVGSGAFDRNATEDPKNYKLIKKYCDDYVDSIPELAAIKLWRNKAYAHFALTDPRITDNAALLDSSVMSPISYFNGRIRVGGVTILTRGAESKLPNWSVTESFEQLKPRFWPNI